MCVCVCSFLFSFFPLQWINLCREYERKIYHLAVKLKLALLSLKNKPKKKKKQKRQLQKNMSSCLLLDSPCWGGALWHSLWPRGLWRSRCYHLNCRSRAAASRLPEPPSSGHMTCLAFNRTDSFLSLYLLQITLHRLWLPGYSWLLFLLSSFLKWGFGNPKRWQEGVGQLVLLSVLSRWQERVGEGTHCLSGPWAAETHDGVWVFGDHRQCQNLDFSLETKAASSIWGPTVLGLEQME